MVLADSLRTVSSTLKLCRMILTRCWSLRVRDAGSLLADLLSLTAVTSLLSLAWINSTALLTTEATGLGSSPLQASSKWEAARTWELATLLLSTSYGSIICCLFSLRGSGKMVGAIIQ